MLLAKGDPSRFPCCVAASWTLVSNCASEPDLKTQAQSQVRYRGRGSIGVLVYDVRPQFFLTAFVTYTVWGVSLAWETVWRNALTACGMVPCLCPWKCLQSLWE